MQLEPSVPESGSDWLPAWLLALGLLSATALLGFILGGLARPFFIVGCAALGLYAWRQGPEHHLQAILTLFCFVALVRRMVDVNAGFDPSGLMLVGPLLAISAPLQDLVLKPAPSTFGHVQMLPLAMVFLSVIYATLLTVFQGDWSGAASGAIKSIAPLIYAFGLISAGASRDTLLEAAASAFLVILPLMGLYGIYQYIDPPEWDRYWMNSASILSAGQPVPYGVRTFSVMNGPASFATFTAAGLMLVVFLRSGLLPIVLTAPAAVAFMLSMYRTAWISLAVGIVFCLLFAATRRRATAMLAGIAVIICLVLLTPFGDAIGERLSSFSGGAADGSARERLEQFSALWMRPDSGMIGNGFVTVDVGSAGSMAIDGMFISSWLNMGMIVGMVCLAGLFLATGNAVAGTWSDHRPTSVIIGALACGAIVQMPLANVISGELGFLFWTFVILVPALSARDATGLDRAR